MSKVLAQAIEEEVINIGQNSRGCKTRLNDSGMDYFGFLRQVKCPSVICEGVFIDSNDRFAADTEEKQKDFGVAYAKDILKTLGITYIEEGTDIEIIRIKMKNIPNNYEFEVDGFVKNGMTYTVTRATLETYGYTVGYEEETNTVTTDGK